MPLNKGFLKSEFKINSIPKLRFWSGILAGLLTAISFYYFSVGLRETMRYLTCLYLDFLWQWETEDVLFYNTIYALFASIFGQTVCLEIWFSGTQKIFWKRNRTRRHQIFVDQKLFSWHFIWFLFKTVLIYFGINFSWALFAYIDFKESFGYLFWLLLANLFLFSWLNISRRFKNYWKLILVFLFSICVISLGLVKIELINPENTNKALIKDNPKYGYQINIPSCINSNRIEKKEWTYDIYFGYPNFEQHNSVEPVLIYNDDIVSISDIQYVLDYERGQREPRIRPYIKPSLFIDSSVCMKYIKKIENEFRYCNSLKLQYMVQNPEYKSFYPGSYSSLGLYHSIDPYIPDSINEASPPPPSSFDPWLECCEFFQISLNAQNEFVVNDSLCSLANLSTKYWDFVVQHEKEGMVVIDINDSSSYYRYIQLLDMIEGTHRSLRKLVSESKYSDRFPKKIMRKEYFVYLKSVQEEIMLSFKPIE